MNTEPLRVLEEFNSLCQGLKKPPKGKSNKDLVGQAFVHSVFNALGKYNTKYALVVGPLWVQGLEFIEWDAAFVDKQRKPIFEGYYPPEDIIALFELKASGIFGLKKKSKGEPKQKTVGQVVSTIKNNFMQAKSTCKNMRECFYISLKERTPKRKGSINYYSKTKKLEPNVVTCIMFESSSIEKGQTPKEYPREWQKLVTKLKQL